jgi:DNA-binding transcriptional LysR family regulator
VLLGHANSVLDTLARAETEVAAVAGLRAGRVRIAAFPSAAATVVVAAMTAMTQDYPGVTFTLTEAEPPKAIDLLERGECDIAVVFRYSTDDDLDSRLGLVSEPLLEEAIQVALPDWHPGSSSDGVAMRDLWDSRWIAGCPDCRGHLVKACEEAGFSPDIAFETDDYVTLQNLARRGLGAALLPDLVRVAARVEGMTARPLNPAQMRYVTALSTDALTRVAGVRQTLNALGEVARAIAAEF